MGGNVKNVLKPKQPYQLSDDDLKELYKSNPHGFVLGLDMKTIDRLVGIKGGNLNELDIVSKYDMLGISCDDFLKHVKLPSRRYSYMEELIKKDISILGRLDIMDIFFLVFKVSQRHLHDLFVLIDENYHWSGTVTFRDLIVSNSFYNNPILKTYSRDRPLRVIDVVCLITILNKNGSFKYFVDKYENDINRSMILAYTIYWMLPEEVKYLIDKGFVLNNTLSIHRPFAKGLNSTYLDLDGVQNLLDLLFDNLDHDELFKHFKNVNTLSKTKCVLVTLKLSQHGYGDKVKGHVLKID